MRTKSIALVVSAIVLGLLCRVGVYAADSAAWKMRVSVRVAAKNDTVKAEFESYVKRELRGLKDVEVVETSPDFSLSFVIVEVRIKGVTLGYAISELVTTPIPQDALRSMLKGKLSDEEMTFYTNAIASAVYLENHQCLACDQNDVKSTCESLIAEFDTGELESNRKVHRTVQEIIEKRRGKP